jgi:type VI secretion system protein VasJ
MYGSMTGLAEQIATQTERIWSPFGGDHPAGEDVSLEPAYEQVKAEIDKLTSLSGGQPNWGAVAEGTGSLLVGRSKDLRLAAWRCLAQCHLSGWDGLADGLVVLKQISEGLWDQAFPPLKRPKGRANLLTWLVEQLMPLVVPMSVSSENAAQVKTSLDLLADLDAFYDRQLSGVYGGLGAARSTLREKLAELPTEDAGAAAQADSPGVSGGDAKEDATATAVLGMTEAAISGAGQAAEAVRASAEALVKAASALRKADPASAWAFRLHREGLYLSLEKLPKVSEGNRTGIGAPPAAMRSRFTAMVADESWSDLVNLAESTLTRHPYWLDLHRHASTGLDRLGALFAPARLAVGRAVVQLAQRVPRLVELEFSDGTPLADEATRSFIDTEARRHLWARSPADRSFLDEEAALRLKLQHARDLLAAGEAQEALRLALDVAERSPDGRTRFRARVEVARLALAAGASKVAHNVVEQLTSEAEERRLESWEPALCARLYACALDCLIAEGEGRDRSLFEKLCRLDPAEALRFQQA